MSSPTPIYVVDANVLIEAHKGYYGFSICPGFWQCLLTQHSAGRVVSIDKVWAEIDIGDDLSEWVKDSAPHTFFATTQNQDVVTNYSSLVTWVQAQTQFTQAAKNEFGQVADGWLIAYTMTFPDHVVVTHEQYNPNVMRRVPIPNVCQQFGVPYVDTFDMLRGLGIQFVLS